MKNKFIGGLLFVLSAAIAAVAVVSALDNVAEATTQHGDDFTFEQGVKLGASGDLISDSFVGTLSTNFTGVAASTVKVSGAITTPGAAVGDVCTVAWPSTVTPTVGFSCYVNATDQTKIVLSNPTAGVANLNPSATYRTRTFDP